MSVYANISYGKFPAFTDCEKECSTFSDYRVLYSSVVNRFGPRTPFD